MKDLQDVLRHKEQELLRLEKEVGILRAAQEILTGDQAHNEIPMPNRGFGVARAADALAQPEEMNADRPKRAFP